MALDIVQYGDPILQRPADKIEHFGEPLQGIVGELRETLRAHKEGIAVAAPQIGASLCAFIYDTGSGEQVVINPTIVDKSVDGWMFKEGCLSIRDHFWWINRPKTVHVEYQDEHGATKYGQFTELEGRLMQHEIDHLNGVLILTHLTKSERKAAMRSLVP